MLKQTVAASERAVLGLLMTVGARGFKLSTLAGGWMPSECCHGATHVRAAFALCLRVRVRVLEGAPSCGTGRPVPCDSSVTPAVAHGGSGDGSDTCARVRAQVPDGECWWRPRPRPARRTRPICNIVIKDTLRLDRRTQGRTSYSRVQRVCGVCVLVWCVRVCLLCCAWCFSCPQ